MDNYPEFVVDTEEPLRPGEPPFEATGWEDVIFDLEEWLEEGK